MSDKHESIFNTLVLYEKVLKNRVKNLKGANIDVVPLDEKKKLDYYSKMYCNDGFRIEYQLPELKNFGRVKQVPYTGLGTFCKEVRGYLAKDIYIDVDMVNCHPVILNWLFRKNGIDNSIIEESVNDRDAFLQNHNITKEAYLSMINNEKCESTDPIIRTLHNQIYVDFLNKMRLQFPDIDRYVKTSRTVNKKGKIVANVLQQHEFEILTSIFHFCKKNGILVDVLMHDGFFIRITDMITEEVIKEKYIHQFENHVFDSFGIPMKFKVKPHDDTIVIKEEPEQNEYELMKENFEKQHCKIINKSFFIKEDDNSLTIFSKQKLETSYNHLNFQSPKKEGPIKFISTWLDDSNMRLYNNIGCYPNNSKCPIDTFNTWRKFSMELITEWTPNEEALQLFLNHIRVLCNNEDVIYDYFIKWIGQMIKHPDVKSICPVLISKEGAGKGTFIELMRKMLGSSKVLETTDPSRDVWGSFNSSMTNSFFVVINELGKKDTVGMLGKIKGLITDTQLNINQKGIDVYPIDSYHRFIITTNELEPITTSKDDRRNLIIRSSDEFIGNKAYFQQLHELLDDVNVIKTCFEYFKNLPGLDKFGQIPKPITEYQRNLQELSVSPIELWIKDLAYTFDKDFEMYGTQAYESFVEFCEKNGFQYETNSKKLGVRLVNMNIKGIYKGRHTRQGDTKLYKVKELRMHFDSQKTIDEYILS